MDVTQDDYGYNLNFTIKDENGVLVNLAAWECKLYLKNINTSETMQRDLVKLESVGSCKYTVQEGDFKIAGIYSYQIRLTNEGILQTVESTQNIIVKEKLWDCSSQQ
jgi:hypothetical protein